MEFHSQVFTGTVSNPGHRAQEYDSLGADYARMLIDELLPVVGGRCHITGDPEQARNASVIRDLVVLVGRS